jgi:hypothetical protein
MNMNDEELTTHRRPGPPSKLTPEKVRAFLKHIKEGKFLREACALESVSYSSFYRGIKHFPEMEQEIKEALEDQRSQFKEEAISTIRKAFQQGIWQAAAWYLERAHSNEYGRVRHEFTGANGGPIMLARGCAEISDDELTRLIAEKESHERRALPESSQA